MRSGRRFLLFTILLIAIGLLNYTVRKKLSYGYADILSYNRIYSVKEQLRILHITRSGADSLSIIFDSAHTARENHFEVYCDGAKMTDEWGPFLKIKPFPAFRTYHIRINSVDSLTLNIEFPGGNFTPEVSGPSILIGEDELPGYKDWAWKLPEPMALRNKEIDSYLSDSMKIAPGDPSAEKVIKISKYLLSVTAGKYGTPSETLASLHPIEQLNRVRSGHSLLYCGNFGSIFAFFSNSAGVVARYVECGVSADGVVNGEHVFNEVYLKECGQWAYVDLTDGNVFVQKNGQYLNAIDIQRLLRYPGPDTGLVALHFLHDGLVPFPFRQANFFAGNAFNSSNVFRFYYGDYLRVTSPANLFEKIKNFLYPRPYYAIYSDNSLPNYSFYLRLCSNYLFLAALMLWTILAIRQGLTGISGWSRGSA